MAGARPKRRRGRALFLAAAVAVLALYLLGRFGDRVVHPRPSSPGYTPGTYETPEPYSPPLLDKTGPFLCADGTTSYAQQSRGACSHHGGVVR